MRRSAASRCARAMEVVGRFAANFALPDDASFNLTLNSRMHFRPSRSAGARLLLVHLVSEMRLSCAIPIQDGWDTCPPHALAEAGAGGAHTDQKLMYSNTAGSR